MGCFCIDKSRWHILRYGANHNGIIGSTAGDINNLAPQQVGTSNNWKNLALRVGGFHFGAVQNDGSLWAWGADNLYQLGNTDGTTTDSYVPTQVTCEDGQLSLYCFRILLRYLELVPK
ncbi:MAG TPA: hypothetical protein DD740_04635 [Chryseobacterium sp.]|nr:hypothetical protein [Chryseobacterium sp.]